MLASPLKAQPSVDIRVEGLSIYASQFEQGKARQVTINFRVVNAGKEPITTPFRTSVFLGNVKPNGSQTVLDTYYLNTAELAAGKTVYVSRTVVVPVDKFDIRVEVDMDNIITEADETNNIAISYYKNPTPDVGRWISIGPTRITFGLGAVGRLSAIAIHPTSPSTIYVGARGSGVWKTTNGGSSWQPLTDALPTLEIAAIAIDPSTPSRVYVATEHEGVFRSEDAGVSWAQIVSSDLNMEVRWGVMIVHPTNPDVLFLTSKDGIYRSADQGANWQLSKAAPVGSIGRATDLVMDPSTPNTLYAGIAGNGIYKTTTSGIAGESSWNKLTAGLPDFSQITIVTLALCRDQPATVYAGLNQKESPLFRLYRTINSGGNWSLRYTHVTGTVPFNDYIAVHPTNRDIVYITGEHFYRSIDGGSTPIIQSGPHVDHHAFTQHPTDPKIIYTASDGGIYRSSDTGKSGTWSFTGEGIANVEFYDIADAVTEPSLVIGGTQDDGTSRYDGSSKVWKYMVGGDSEANEIDPINAKVLYEVGQEMHQLKQSTDGGVNWPEIGSGLPEGCSGSSEFGPPDNHFLVHPTMPSTLLATCGSLWRGLPWTTIFTPTSGSIVRLGVDPTINLYYAGSNLGKLYAGPAGVSWQEVFSHPNTRRITDIEVDLDDPETLYVSFIGTGVGRVYRLRRSSATPPTMTALDITSDLPSGFSVNAVGVDRMAPLTIYAGTNKGVYRGRSTDGGATWSWTPYNNGLPAAVFISDLEVHPTTGVMRIATFGRGAFEVNTDFPIGSIIAADGKVTLLRAHDVGTGYGPPTDQIDVEVVVWLDSQPGKAFGFQLRNDANEGTHRGMLGRLRDAFNHDRPIRLDYVRTGLHNGRILRVMNIP
jgi:photosystem II stability/assembly factor-like uncharacterized protein